MLVEGLDSSGKTTLANQIASFFKTEVRHDLGPKTFHDMSEWMLEQVPIINHGGPVAVYDRWPLISEGVYGPLLRGKSEFDQLSSTAVAASALWDYYTGHYRVVIIYCNPGLERIRETLENNEQMHGVADNLNHLYGAYEEQMAGWELCSDYSKNTDHRFWVLPYNYRQIGAWSQILGQIHYIQALSQEAQYR